MSRLDSRWVLAAGVLVSAAMHLGLGVVVARYAGFAEPVIRLVSSTPRPAPERAPPPPERELPRPEPPTPEAPPTRVKELKLGLTDAPDSASVAWLGFTEPTEHRAREGITEQSPMSLSPAPAAVTEAPAGVPEPRPVAAAPPSPPAAPAPQIAGMPEGEIQQPAEPPAPTPVDLRPVGKALIDAGGKLAEAIGQALERVSAAGPRRAADAPEPKPARPESAPAPGERPPVARGDAPAATPAPPAPQPPAAKAGNPGATGGMPGLKSDRESIAVSLKNAPVVVPGRVLAAQGLEVLTRSPRFDRLTVATQRPRNPAVRVLFGKNGKVKRAEFVVLDGEEYNTGSPEVDRQLMNSVYAWTAKGRAVDELSKDDPDAAVSIVFSILLR
jgi:hypothetical protein